MLVAAVTCFETVSSDAAMSMSVWLPTIFNCVPLACALMPSIPASLMSVTTSDKSVPVNTTSSLLIVIPCPANTVGLVLAPVTCAPSYGIYSPYGMLLMPSSSNVFAVTFDAVYTTPPLDA